MGTYTYIILKVILYSPSDEYVTKTVQDILNHIRNMQITRHR